MKVLKTVGVVFLSKLTDSFTLAFLIIDGMEAYAKFFKTKLFLSQISGIAYE